MEAREHAEARKNQTGGGRRRGQIHKLVLSHFIVAKLPGRPDHPYVGLEKIQDLEIFKRA